MAKLTRFSTLLNSNDYLFSKFFSKTSSFFSFQTNFILLSFSHENNYYFLPQTLYMTSSTFNFTKILNKVNNAIFNLHVFKSRKKFNIFLNLDLILSFYFKPIFFKYFLYFNNENSFKSSKTLSILENSAHLEDLFFYSKNDSIFSNNVLPDPKFNYVLKKKMLKIFNYSKFPTITTI
jgi:hypothetical protein